MKKLKNDGATFPVVPLVLVGVPFSSILLGKKKFKTWMCYIENENEETWPKTGGILNRYDFAYEGCDFINIIWKTTGNKVDKIAEKEQYKQ